MAAAIVVLVGCGIAAGIWRLTGGSWMIIATPSMGEAAPVGTLVLDRPTTVDQLAVGDVISFAPTGSNATYTHRVAAINPDGTLQTKGDANGSADPWSIGQDQLKGKVVASVWGLGWLIKAAPLLVLGAVVLWFATGRWVSSTWRAPARILGLSFLVALAGFILRPYVNQVLVSTTRTGQNMQIAVISTGLLPIRVTAHTGGHVDLIDGRLRTIATTLPADVDGTQLTSTVHLSLWGWVLMIPIWLTPLLAALFILWRDHRLRSRPTDQPSGGSAVVSTTTAPIAAAADSQSTAAVSSASTDRPNGIGRHRRLPSPNPRSRARVVAVAAAVTALVGGGASTTSTASAFTAKLTNSQNTASSNSFFSCEQAAEHSGALIAYPLTDDPGSFLHLPASDVSGNNKDGNYQGLQGGINGSHSTLAPCKRDANGSWAVSGVGEYVSPWFSLIPRPVPSTNVFSLAIWFRSTGGTGGRLIGFGSYHTSQSTVNDRQLWLSNAGNVVFGVRPSTVVTINSASGYNDGAWHLAVATLSPAGMALYVDGDLKASNTLTTTSESYNGHWRVGADRLDSSTWGSLAPTNLSITGNLAYASVYGRALTAAEVLALYRAKG